MGLYESPLGKMPLVTESHGRAPYFGGDGGYIERDWDADPFCGFAAPFDLPLIHRVEWPERIEEMEREAATIRDLCKRRKLPHKDQSGTNYCWSNGVTYCVETSRLVANQPKVELSSAAVAAPIKGFRNVGGWGMQAVRYYSQHGGVPMSMWPNAAIHRKYDTAETRAIRAEYRASEWWELPNKRTHGREAFDAIVSLLLYGLPGAVAFNWWRHLVTATGVKVLRASRNPAESVFGLEIRNSHRNYGDDGYAVLSEAKGTPDEATAIRVVAA